MSLLIHLYMHKPSVPLEKLFIYCFGILVCVFVTLQNFLCST